MVTVVDEGAILANKTWVGQGRPGEARGGQGRPGEARRG